MYLVLHLWLLISKNIYLPLHADKTIMLMNTLLFSLGGPEVIVIVLVILLLFGGKKIPELMKGLGKGVRSFKDGMNEVEKDLTDIDTDNKDKDKREA